MSNDLTHPGGLVRLFVEADLKEGVRVPLADAQSHYLLRVMRAKPGDRLHVFNGRDGEWLAGIDAGKRGASVICETRIAEQVDVPDVWLLFAPIKRTPADYVVQKATELGVRVLQPVNTRRTIVSRVNLARMHANAIEAAEQSGRLTVPEVRAAVPLTKLLASWNAQRIVIHCDEEGDAKPIADALAHLNDSPFAILTGPEGGFDQDERNLLRSCSFVTSVSLGERVLRADTAALAALSIWQALRGDWH